MNWTAMAALTNTLMAAATFYLAYTTRRALRVQKDQLIQAVSPRFFVVHEFNGHGQLPTLRLRNRGSGPAYDVVVTLQNPSTGEQREALRIEYWPTRPDVQYDFNAPDSRCIPADALKEITGMRGQEIHQKDFSVEIRVMVRYLDRLFEEHTVSCPVRLCWDSDKTDWTAKYPKGQSLQPFVG